MRNFPPSAQPGDYEIAASIVDDSNSNITNWQLPQISYNPSQPQYTSIAYGQSLQASNYQVADPPLVIIDTTDPSITSANQVTVTAGTSSNPNVPFPLITGISLTQLPNGVTQIVVNGVVSAVQPGIGPVNTVPLNITLGNESTMTAEVVLNETSSTYTVNPVDVQVSQGQPVQNVLVANLTGPENGSYSATIHWGDGDTSTGEITPLGGGEFSVTGTKPHPYATAGSNTITVTVTGPGTTPAPPAVTMATVSPVLLALGGLTATQWNLNQSGYNGTIAVSYGSGSYSHLQVTGLPAGLSASLSGSTITMSGTPTQVGTFSNIVVSLQDNSGIQGSRTYSLTINAAVSYLVDSKGQLFTVAEPSGQTQFVAQTGQTFLDIGLSPTGQLYGVANANLYQINTTTGTTTSIGSIVDQATGLPIYYTANALEFRADGTLFVAVRNSLYQVNPQTAVATFVLALPYNESSAGDLVFDSHNDLFLTTNDGSLVEANPSLTSDNLVGATGALGIDDMNGLVYTNGTLYGFGQAENALYQINTSTGATTLSADLSIFHGMSPQGVYGVATLPTPVASSTLTVQGTTGNDTFTFTAGSPSQYSLNGVSYTVPAGITTIHFVSNGGSDSTTLHGSGQR